jgi:hypothetical protein
MSHQLLYSANKALVRALAQEFKDEFYMATDFHLIVTPPTLQPNYDKSGLSANMWSIDIDDKAKNYEATLREMVIFGRGFVHGWNARQCEDLWSGSEHQDRLSILDLKP